MIVHRSQFHIPGPSSFIFAGCESIHLEAVLVPQYRYRGSNASLLCKYELESNEELFSLKWYKEDTEFYRHTENRCLLLTI